MFREGELSVRLGLGSGRIRSVQIASTRATLPARLTRGRPADDVARTMPLLFSICARAQGAAAAGALDAARGRRMDAERLRERNDDVRREAAIELLTRLLLDWPRVLGEAPEVAALARARQAAPANLLQIARDIATERVYGRSPDGWLADASLTQLALWCERTMTQPAQLLSKLQREPELGRSDVGPMPAVTGDALVTLLPAPGERPDFSRAPDWHGRPVETGALARRAGHPLVAAYVARHGNSVAARFVAQLVDLAALLCDSGAEPVRQHAAGTGTGVGVAETARGVLLHQAQVDSIGRVEHYRVVAPTEWNFHPQGALARGLAGREVDGTATARRDATLLAQALDPCVAFSVEVTDA